MLNGDAIESLFDYLAMSKGFTVSAPRSNMAQYDRILDANSKLFRIQIKGRKSGGDSVLVHPKRKQGRAQYKDEDYDVLAVYIENNDSWYFYTNKKNSFRINTKNEALNNWDIFETL